MQTVAFIEMSKVSKASEPKKYSIFHDGLIKTVDRILMAKLTKKKFICMPAACKYSPINLQLNW